MTQLSKPTQTATSVNAPQQNPHVTIQFQVWGQYTSFTVDALAITRHFAIHHYMRLNKDWQSVTANTSLYTVTCRYNGFKAGTFPDYDKACAYAKSLDAMMNWRIVRDDDSLCKIPFEVKQKALKLCKELGGNYSV